MSLLAELKRITDTLNIPAQTSIFDAPAPDKYIVFTPIVDDYHLFADNKPNVDVEEVRISYFDKGNYLAGKKAIENAVIAAEITITDRRYLGHEDDTGYHHYAIDVAKNYQIEEE